MQNSRKSLSAIALTATLAAGLLAGCSAEEPVQPPETGGQASAISLKVGVPYGANGVSAFVAEQEGYFEQEGLDVELVEVQSGAEAVPMLLNGQLNITLGDGIGTMTASSNGVPLALFGIATVQPSDPDLDATAIYSQAVLATEDLTGKTVAVGQLGGAAELAAKAAIDAEGGDSTKVNFVELAAAQMPTAISSGTVDAGLLTEPFATAAGNQGLHLVTRPAASGTPGFLATTWLTTIEYGNANADALEGFVRAIEKAGIQSNEDTKMAREVAGTFMDAPADVLAEIRFPVFADNVADTSNVQDFLDMANKYGIFAQQPDLDKLLSVKVNP